MKRVDLSTVNHSPHDGRLLADSFDISMCGECTGAHVDLIGPDGTVFATATIGPEMFRGIAAKFCEFEEYVGRMAPELVPRKSS